jgi:hypothetical protein
LTSQFDATLRIIDASLLVLAVSPNVLDDATM